MAACLFKKLCTIRRRVVQAADLHLESGGSIKAQVDEEQGFDGVRISHVVEDVVTLCRASAISSALVLSLDV